MLSGIRNARSIWDTGKRTMASLLSSTYHPGKARNVQLGRLLLLCCELHHRVGFFLASQAASGYVLECDTCVRGVELRQMVKEDCL